MNLITVLLFHVVVYSSNCTISQTYDVEQIGFETTEHGLPMMLLVNNNKTTEVDISKEKGVEATIGNVLWTYKVEDGSLLLNQSLGCEKI